MSDTPRRTLTDGSPVTADHRDLKPNGQQKGYVVLAPEERAKGFVRPVRLSYKHTVCGTVTHMARSLAETYAVNPKFYSGTFCAGCRKHFSLNEFVWEGTDEVLGSDLRRKIYVASSWRNIDQPAIVAALRRAGHEVYDFRNPKEGDAGFAWRELDDDFHNWTPERFVELLDHPVARAGFASDRDALDWCDTCVCVLPCGRSAHLEAGYAIGRGKETIFYLTPERFEPELMYLLGHGFAFDFEQLVARLA